MSSVSGKDLAKALERHGWALVRAHGSHHIDIKPGSPVRLSVPVHGNRRVKTSLLQHLLKLAGLDEEAIA